MLAFFNLFQTSLMEYMTRQMVESQNNNNNNQGSKTSSGVPDLSYLFSQDNADLTLEERVGKWKFSQMDTNRNGVII